MTGRLALSFTPGVHTFSVRQFSLTGLDGCGRAELGRMAGCGARGPNSSASRTPVQGCTGCGALNRYLAVSSPYGMPLKTLIPSRMAPRTFPLLRPTTGDSEPAFESDARNAAAVAVLNNRALRVSNSPTDSVILKSPY